MNATLSPETSDPSCPAGEGDPLAGLTTALARCRSIAASLPPEIYAREVHGRDSIGAHLRHALEHVQSLNAGLAGGVIDYDARGRDPQVEADPARFLDALDAACAALARLAPPPGAPLRVRTMTGPDGARATVGSTAGREFAFVAQHAIHHLALIRLTARLHGVELPAELCIAFSTAAHLAKAGA